MSARRDLSSGTMKSAGSKTTMKAPARAVLGIELPLLDEPMDHANYAR
ncbi:hypothetical protein [Bradyrhizobium sp.]|nr:hypothetical protein [Bradyrhizobium sp.]